MGGIRMRLRAEIRAGWRAWLSLALLLGLAAGASLAAAAGARRTATAYARFLEAQDAFDAITGGGAEDEYEEHLAAVKADPAVKDWIDGVIVGGVVIVPARRGRPEQELGFPNVFLSADPTGRLFYETNRAKVVNGRLANRSAADETMVPFTAAERYGIRVGDTIRAGVGFDQESFAPLRIVNLKVVGVTAAPGDFEALGQSSFLTIYATPAFVEKYKELIPPRIPDLTSTFVHLRGGGAAAVAFKKRVEGKLNIDVPVIEPVITSAVQKNMRLYVAALWLLATFIALAGVSIFGQTLARQSVLDAGDYPTLRALGFGRRDLIMMGLVRAGLIGVAAAATGTALAFLASPLTPIGSARIAEPSPGFAFDATALGVGAVATVIVVMAIGLFASAHAARLSAFERAGEPGPERASRVVAGAGAAGFSPSAVTGLRMALEPGRGRTAVPVRSTIVAVSIALVAVTATVIVGRSLSHLIETPSLTGFTYDAIMPGDDRVGGTDAEREAKLKAFPFIDAVTVGTGVNIDIGGVDSFLIGFQSGGGIGFAEISGRVPTDTLHGTVPEVALGPATMRRMHARVGDSVTIGYSTQDDERTSAKALVVGTVAIPALPWAATDPGEGAVMTTDAIRSFNADSDGGCCFVRFKKGVDLETARTAVHAAGFEVLIRTKRSDLVTLERISGLPLVLSLVFGVMAMSALAHVLVTALRRRRRDLAILKTLGFLKRDIRRAVAWQASTVAVLSVAIGVPAGLVLGRWGWRAVADQFGAVPVAVTPAIVAALLPAALLVANIVALLPARSAVRTRPAAILRED